MTESAAREKFDVDAFIEYHIGDCSCEHGHECQSCTMKGELKRANLVEMPSREGLLSVINDWENTPDCPDNEWDLVERLVNFLKGVK